MMAGQGRGGVAVYDVGCAFNPDVEARELDPALYLVGLIARNG